MYKNRKLKRNPITKVKVSNEQKRPLKVIDENASVKLSRRESDSSTSISNQDVPIFNKEAGDLAEMFSSEENIPASQEPTQRYLSQRSMVATLTRTQSRNVSQRPPNTYFELVLMQAGVQLDEGENFVISCDHIAFVTKFREILIRSPNYPENVETLKTGLREALDSKSKLSVKLLSGCSISIPGEDSVYQSQDSMIVNLLMIDFLRDHVLEILLDKIAIAAKPENVRYKNSNVPLLPLMLAQLRCVTLARGEHIYNRIKEIFESATENAKWEIVASAELILDVSKHDEFAQLLLDNLAGSRDFFQTTTIQALTNLSLSSRMQGKLRSKILAYIQEEQCPMNILPVLVNFLLKILNDDCEDNARELVHALRKILIFNSNSVVSANEKQIQLELFRYIEQGLIRSRKFYYVWQKTIAALPAVKFGSIDFIILLLLIHIKEDNSLYIENILRRRIKLEHITIEIFNEARTKYAAILEMHTNILMQILHDFLREKHKLVSGFARAAYGILFQMCESTQKNILKNLLELTCDKSATNMTTLALELLKELQCKYAKEVQNYGMLLMPLLDRLNEVSLPQTRVIMEILCSIAFPPPNLNECPTLQDQIDMLVKKQMISRKPFVKKQGIIGSVQLVDSIARIEDTCMNMDDFNTTYDTLDGLPDGRGKMAATYIVRIQSSTMYCAESLALFYDELANVCAAVPKDHNNIRFWDKPFLMWLCELVTYAFQSNFVAERSPEKIGGFNLTYQKCINSLEDTNTEDQENEVLSVAINISELVLKPAEEAPASILVLASHFNLVRVLHSLRNEGSLEQINALLGCAIILPDFFDDPNTDAIFYNYDEQQQRNILDIYFHCVNWMRETVSSFATQQEAMIRNKVLQRLAELIRIEEKIRRLLVRASPDYMPPMCQFMDVQNNNVHTSQKPGGRGRPAVNVQQKPKRGKNKPDQTETEHSLCNETNASTNMNATHFGDVTNAKLAGMDRKGTSARTNFEQLYGPREIYRQMDFNIMLILREKLNVTFPLPPEEIGHKIGLLEVRFILTDLVCKLESITGVQKFQSEQLLQYVAKPYYFMYDLSTFLRAIVENIEILSSAITAQLERVQHVNSHEVLFTEEFSYLKVCFELSLRLLAAFFSWSEFLETTHAKLLKDSLLGLLDQKKSSQLRAKTISFLTIEAFNKFLNYEAAVVDLKTAVHFFQLLTTLKRLYTHALDAQTDRTLEESLRRQQANDLRVLCKTLLCRKWYNYYGALEKGANCNVYLDELVKGFLRDSNFGRQRDILRVVLEETKLLSGKDAALKSFPNIKKANFPLLFRGLCEVLITSLSDKITINDNADDKLRVWEKSCSLLNSLLDIVKALDVPRNFQLFLKYAHLYLKMVLQHGLPTFEQYLRQSPERVNELLKNLQVTTRFLHKLCVHSKALKKIAIISQIPFLRETVENLVFRVKALLVANKCASAFWMGSLQNRDLHDDKIVSQTASLEEPAAENSDEEIPEDDASVDETVLGHSQTAMEEDRSSITDGNRSKSSSRSKCL